MKILPTLSAIALATAALQAQDQVVEIAPIPIIVTGTFELRQPPPAVDSFTRHLERQIETKRTEQEAVARSPIWNARFWSFIPIRLESSRDSGQFFIPHYLKPEYREAARPIEDFRLHSLFDARPGAKN